MLRRLHVRRAAGDPTTDAGPSLVVDGLPQPRRRYGEWALGLVVLVVVGLVVRSLYTNRNIDHHVIGEYLFSSPILSGLWVTIQLSLLAEVIGIVGGLILALARQSHNVVISWLSWAYTWLFRGTPLLVQVIFWGNIALLLRTVQVGIPFTGVVWFHTSTNTLITPFVAATLALGLNEAAYQSEVFRSGILSVPAGQRNAGKALGMTRWRVDRHIVLPQALRVVIPPTANQFISLLKASALVSVIAGGDLLTRAEDIYAANYRTVELLLVAAFWYIVLTSLTYVGQHFLERRAGRGYGRSALRGLRGSA